MLGLAPHGAATAGVLLWVGVLRKLVFLSGPHPGPASGAGTRLGMRSECVGVPGVGGGGMGGSGIRGAGCWDGLGKGAVLVVMCCRLLRLELWREAGRELGLLPGGGGFTSGLRTIHASARRWRVGVMCATC